MRMPRGAARAPPAADIKRELDKMKKALDAAKAREARARKAHKAALRITSYNVCYTKLLRADHVMDELHGMAGTAAAQVESPIRDGVEKGARTLECP